MSTTVVPEGTDHISSTHVEYVSKCNQIITYNGEHVVELDKKIAEIHKDTGSKVIGLIRDYRSAEVDSKQEVDISPWEMELIDTISGDVKRYNEQEEEYRQKTREAMCDMIMFEANMKNDVDEMLERALHATQRPIYQTLLSARHKEPWIHVDLKKVAKMANHEDMRILRAIYHGALGERDRERLWSDFFAAIEVFHESGNSFEGDKDTLLLSSGKEEDENTGEDTASEKKQGGLGVRIIEVLKSIPEKLW